LFSYISLNLSPCSILTTCPVHSPLEKVRLIKT
jgi:hypothetical protein